MYLGYVLIFVLKVGVIFRTDVVKVVVVVVVASSHI